MSETKVFTFEVKMEINVFATTEEEAKAKLDSEGGFPTERNVVLRAITPLVKAKKAALTSIKKETSDDSAL